MKKRPTLNLPKHTNPTDPRRIACAPYNFVPLPDKVILAVEDANKLPDHDTYADETYKHTGHFDVTLTTRSPLYVRCPLTRDKFDLDEQGKDCNGDPVNDQTRYADRIKNTPDFSYTRDKEQPVIPGSSLRGMLRSLLEIISYGKMQAVGDKQLSFRAVGDPTALGIYYREKMQTKISAGYCPKVKAGYLSKSGSSYSITPAETTPDGLQFYRVEESTAIMNVTGLVDMRRLISIPTTPPAPPKQHYEPNPAYKWMRREVWFQPVSPVAHLHSNNTRMYYGSVSVLQELAPTTGAHLYKRGVFIASGWIPSGQLRLGKHLHWIINSKGTLPPIRISDEDVLAYTDGGGITDRIEAENFSVLPPSGQEVACFYAEWQDRKRKHCVAVGHTPYFRLPYEATLLGFVPEDLRRAEDVDFAEAIFGYTKKEGVKKQRAYASRVFVTDAALADAPNGLWLSSQPITPKILATPKPTCFQHYLVQTNSDHNRELSHYSSPSPEKIVIRGHKLYWHQGNSRENDIKEDNQRWFINGRVDETSRQHTQMKPVKTGVTFRFRVHFENLSEEELGAMCWTLHPLGDASTSYFHKLGMGKPFGMGVVELKATLYLSNRQTRYGSLFDGDGWQTGYSADGEQLNQESVKARAQRFEEKIIEELKPFVDGKSCNHLGDLKRIAMLLRMMDKKTGPPPRGPKPGIGAEHQDRVRNTRYMTIELEGVAANQKNEYKERPVLPDPSDFGELTGDTEPLTEASVPATRGNPTDVSARAGRSAAPHQDILSAKRDSGGARQKSRISETPNLSQWTKPIPKPQKPKVTEAKEKVTLLTELTKGRARVRSSDGQEIDARFNESLRVEVGARYHAQVKRQDGKIIAAEVRALV